MSQQTLNWDTYLANAPPERRDAIQQVWSSVREHMPAGYQETIGSKFVTFGTEGEAYVSLANQKNYISLYLVPVYIYPELKAKLDESDKNLKCGKSCINFKRADELPLDVIGEIIGATPAEAYIAKVRSVREEARVARKKEKGEGMKDKG